jgi:hypothetical protein
MSEVLLGEMYSQSSTYMKTHYMHNWVDMAVLLEIQQMNTVVVCFHISTSLCDRVIRKSKGPVKATGC